MGGRNASSGIGGYKTFSDTARSSHEYNGDGQEQVDFFMSNSNVDELISGMSYDDRDAFHSWASGYFMDGAQYGGWDSMTNTEKQRTQRYDDVLDRSVLTQGVVLTRRSDAQLVLGAGKRTATLGELQSAKGSIITSKGSMSFGAASQGLTIGDSSKRVEYRLKIPGGERSKGSGMWIGDSRINGWGPAQREFMTNRDTSYRVGNTRHDKRRDIYVVDIEFLGVSAHDYGRSGRLKM